MKALSNGQGTDDRLYGLEMRHKFLVSQMSELASLIIPSKEIHIKEQIIEKGFDWNVVVNSLKNV